jgi:tRNA pseudouridine65 synthase
VLVFALSSEAARAAQQTLQAGRWHKEYLALVRGITPVTGRIDYPLAAEKHKPKKDAVTSFARIGVFERYSLLRVFPQTGRLHQIRRHLRHISHPLIGDVRYGKAEHNRIFRQRFDLHRLCLHATYLGFPHPENGVDLKVDAPLPPDLAAPFRQMGFELG